MDELVAHLNNVYSKYSSVYQPANMKFTSQIVLFSRNFRGAGIRENNNCIASGRTPFALLTEG